MVIGLDDDHMGEYCAELSMVCFVYSYATVGAHSRDSPRSQTAYISLVGPP
jgi:hypothetical protein